MSKILSISALTTAGRPDGVTRLWLIATVAGLAGTFLFFIPVLGMYRTGSANWPGFMLTGDIRMLWFPQFVSGYHRFWDGSILGADFFTDGGASVFGLRANLLPLYPPFLLSYLVFDIGNLRVAQIVFTAIYAIHEFVGLFFCVLLGRRFLRMSLGASVLFAALYSLSYQAADYVKFTPFFFQMMLMPALAYWLCRLLYARSLAAPILGSLVVVLYMMTSYGPLMAAGMLMASTITLFVFYDKFWGRMRRRIVLRRLLPPALSIAMALLVALPYYVGQASFVATTSTAPADLAFVAHASSFTGRDLVHALSPSILGAPAVEGRLHWGLVAAAIAAAGLLVVAYNSERLPPRSLALFGFGLSLYAVVMFATFGLGSIVPDIVYYVAPLVGNMHLYQRFLMFAQLPFAMAVAIAASFVVTMASPRQRAALLTVGLVLWLGLSFWIATSRSADAIFDVGRFLPELFLMFLALTVLAIGRSSFAVAAVAVPAVATMLTPNFDLQRNLGSKAIWQTTLPPTQQALRSVGDLFVAEGKVLPKVLNVTDAVDSYLPYNLSWMLPSGRPYMNYFGYEPHLAMDRDYLAMMGGFYGRFNRQWITRTGADFVVWDKASRGKLDEIAGNGVTMEDPKPIGGGLSVSRLRYARAPTLGQGDVLLSYSASKPSAWRVEAIDGWRLEDGRMVKTKEGTNNHFAIPLSPQIGVVYTVTFDIVGSAKGAIWVALGGKQAEDALPGNAPGRRTLSFDVKDVGDLWFSATPDFDGALTNITVREATTSAITDAFAAVFDNGVIRLEAPGRESSVNSFATNWSTHLVANVEANTPARLVYLLWPSRYLVPYLDGTPVEWIRMPGWPAYLNVPAGTHQFELRFKSRWALALQLGTGLYILFLLTALIVIGARRRKTRQAPIIRPHDRETSYQRP